MKTQNILLTLLIIAAGVLSFYWFLETYELREIEEYSGRQGEARENNLYAARLFLNEMGLTAKRYDRLNNLPDTNTIIVLNTQRYTLSQISVTQLLEWVENGGQLITRLRNGSTTAQKDSLSSQRHDLLQEKLGISSDGEWIDVDSTEEFEETDGLLIATLPEQTRPYKIALDFFYTIKTSQTAQWRLPLPEQENNYWLIQKRYGMGNITLISNLDFIENSDIAHYDHAAFFWQLLHMNSTPKQVWLIANDYHPALLTLLWQYAWIVMISLLLLVAGAIWQKQARLGPLQALPTLARRRILEHVEASGRFMWRYQSKGREQLIHSMRQSLLVLAQRHIPNWGALNAEARYEALATHLQQSSQLIPTLLEKPTLNDQQFLLLVTLNQRLRNLS